MWKPLVRSSIIGGIVVFLWMMISWTVLPFHEMMIKKVKNPTEVISCVSRNTPEDGIYTIPHMDDGDTVASANGDKSPFIFVNINRSVEFSAMTKPIIVGIILQIIGAFLLTYLLLQAKAMKFWKKVRFITIGGLTVALLGAVPSWNWWHYPGSWVFLECLDYVIGWFLGGLVIAKLSKK
ncbi:MAG: hypothetical protein KR126chlam1_00737 [Chlamydiae bacterium]|nr:hypothetical protein [Chlamydiota bacterium]